MKKDIPMAQDTSNDVSWAFVICRRVGAACWGLSHPVAVVVHRRGDVAATGCVVVSLCVVVVCGGDVPVAVVLLLSLYIER
jgi:hypothetical protein